MRSARSAWIGAALGRGIWRQPDRRGLGEEWRRQVVATATRERILGTSPSKEEILKRVKDEQVEFIDLQFTDVMGLVKSVTLPASILGHVIDGGQWIDGSSIAGFTRIAESDMYLEPDLSTFAVLPWTKGEH